MGGDARGPNLVEDVEVAPGDGRLVRVGDALPAVRVRAEYQRIVVDDHEGFIVIPVILVDVPELHEAAQPAPEIDETIAVPKRPVGVRDQDPDARVAARKAQVLDRIDELLVVEDDRRQVTGHDRDISHGEARDGDHRVPEIGIAGEDLPRTRHRLLLEFRNRAHSQSSSTRLFINRCGMPASSNSSPSSTKPNAA